MGRKFVLIFILPTFHVPGPGWVFPILCSTVLDHHPNSRENENQLTKHQVIFAGTTTFGYEEWSGPLISFSGANIDISGASGHLIDGGGARWVRI
jgi:hypothetical protein